MTAGPGPGHDRWEDAAGAYVLGAMPPEEAAAYAEHIAQCPVCRAEVDGLAPAVAALPASVPPVAAPRALRDRLMAEVRREAELLAAAGGEADRPEPAATRRRRPAWLGWRVPALSAAALLVGLAAGLGVANLGGGTRTVPVQVARSAGGAKARLVIADGHATLEADALPPPPDNRIYQVWLKPPGGNPQPTDALFAPRADGTAAVAVPGDVESMRAVMVTAEPAGGSAAPTRPPVLTAPLS